MCLVQSVWVVREKVCVFGSICMGGERKKVTALFLLAFVASMLKMYSRFIWCLPFFRCRSSGGQVVCLGRRAISQVSVEKPHNQHPSAPTSLP